MHPHETLTKEPNPINDIGFGPETKFETRLEALRRESRERRGMIEATMVEAETNGELWTVQAAMFPGRVFCLVYHGRVDDTDPLESQHQPPAIFGPLHLIGDHRHVMLEAMKLFMVDEITIRTVRNPA